ncbi:hypothetical protein KKA95_02150 [Patescibacteria group bacterium]|nr:hypothetical protein [Patescibacteria group bacterium]
MNQMPIDNPQKQRFSDRLIERGVDDEMKVMGCDLVRRAMSEQDRLNPSFSFVRSGDPGWSREFCKQISGALRDQITGRISCDEMGEKRWSNNLDIPEFDRSPVVVQAVDAYRKALGSLLRNQDLGTARETDPPDFSEDVEVIKKCICDNEDLRVKTWVHDLCHPVTPIGAYFEMWSMHRQFSLDANEQIIEFGQAIDTFSDLMKRLRFEGLSDFFAFYDEHQDTFLSFGEHVFGNPNISVSSQNQFLKALRVMAVMMKDFQSEMEGGYKEMIQIDFDRMFRNLGHFSQILGSDVDFTTTTEDDLSLVMNPTDIGRIMQNLISNSHEAMQDQDGEKTINISAERVVTEGDDDADPANIVYSHLEPLTDSTQLVKLSVSDNGPGVNPSLLGHIFRPRFSTKGEFGENSGLGLSSIVKIVAQYNGGITVKTIPGIGVTFEILFPETILH